MKKILSFSFLLLFFSTLRSQTEQQWNSAEILQNMQKLKVLGSVLYIAAHPDDENTRLLAWLSKEKLYRTGYLSITRGDGGQNLIGNEQGVELGLLRTQELLSARKFDGSDQYFTRAYDFGYSKRTEEALSLWNQEKILGDVVWIIRKFRPDVIITRFPPDSRAGHGQHSASAVLARMAFDAAGDPSRYPEQLSRGVTVWKPRRIFLNTFNFGNTNITREDQLKIDVGGFNPLVGKSYGEIATESRNQHKSQGFGFYSSRGTSYEYFELTAGDSVSKGLLDGINTEWSRLEGGEKIASQIDQLLQAYSPTNPEKSVPGLVKLYNSVAGLKESSWKSRKLTEIQALIQACSGLYLEASSPQQFAVQGDSLRMQFFLNNREGINARLVTVSCDNFISNGEKELSGNANVEISKTIFVSPDKPITQPYWLEEPMLKASYQVNDPEMIGMPWTPPAYVASFRINVEGTVFEFKKPLLYKFRDPVRGEIFDPLPVVPPVSAEIPEASRILIKGQPVKMKNDNRYIANRDLNGLKIYEDDRILVNETATIRKGQTKFFPQEPASTSGTMGVADQGEIPYRYYLRPKDVPLRILREISYDHIPSIYYFKDAVINNIWLDLKTEGKKLGYIKGAGDKVPEALEQMGYQVTFLEENDINLSTLKGFDAIITGVRAYNVHDWMAGANAVLMDYVSQGGNLVIQYNTNNFAGQLHSRIGPYPMEISNKRVTDEDSPVRFLDKDNLVLNWPNKITMKDFEGWTQERGIYFADKLSSEYKPVLGMKDPEEDELTGSLIVANYGKGRFIYTGLSFFRELPAGVPGAYRLFANLVSNPLLIHAPGK